MQVAAMGTYFNGVLSADARLQMVSNTARAVLRGFNSYVGEDWSVPQADCDRTISMDEQPSGAS
jgi:hypothetical protein